MPEFILDHGSPAAARSFQTLDSFTQGYVEAMFFTDASSADDGELEHATFADLAPDTLARIIEDCAKFQQSQSMFLRIARDLEPGEEIFRYAKDSLDDRRLGQLFWYARNGHGVSFRDDGSAIALEKLQEAAQACRALNVYLGDDGKVHVQ